MKKRIILTIAFFITIIIGVAGALYFGRPVSVEYVRLLNDGTYTSMAVRNIWLCGAFIIYGVGGLLVVLALSLGMTVETVNIRFKNIKIHRGADKSRICISLDSEDWILDSGDTFYYKVTEENKDKLYILSRRNFWGYEIHRTLVLE